MRDKAPRDKPWIFRTYAGHSTARDSNALYRKNLAKGQTGLSVAFDLPTQTGYDSDHVLARGEVGKVGVPICHLGDMRALFDQIPLAAMNTSMTINATAAWLMALYIAVADEQGAPRAALQGTIQNDIIKEYLSRGTYVFPPAPSMRLIKDIAIFTTGDLRTALALSANFTVYDDEASPEARAAATIFEVLSPYQDEDVDGCGDTEGCAMSRDTTLSGGQAAMDGGESGRPRADVLAARGAGVGQKSVV